MDPIRNAREKNLKLLEKTCPRRRKSVTSNKKKIQSQRKNEAQKHMQGQTREKSEPQSTIFSLFHCRH